MPSEGVPEAGEIDSEALLLAKLRDYAALLPDPGLRTRVATKLLVRTVKQFVNFHAGSPINQTKHCWAALIQ